MNDPKRHVENELLERVREAERAYRQVASSAKEKTRRAKDIGWQQPDGAYAFRSAMAGEQVALEKYRKALTMFNDFLLYKKAPSPRVLLGPVLNRAIEASGASMGTLQVIDRTKEALYIRAQRGFGASFLEFFKRVDSRDRCACGAAFAAMLPVLVSDVKKNPVFAGTDALRILTDAGVRAVRSVPMINPSGKLVGVLSVHYAKPVRLAALDSSTLDQFAREATTLVMGAGLA